ncbi:DEAD/DEAH box helicase [Senegalia sp. (in: firmicutes)]|uniref:DEAD/DEAH box helicase n=2 Tax=Senegalia sp. (in: firmicutes) TaxID=1924098 RepID=UPI003F976996
MSSYNLLQREIRRYIYDEGWEALRNIQEASIKRVHDTDNNLILAAPTASGKTEAAFLPAINLIKDWDSGLKIIYISPLIALINDQFKRILELCNYMNIPVTSWHGEASRTKKSKLLKEPKGILLITPESIEAMLSLRPGEARGLFNGTEWIIVDEIHSFLENNRGIQLRSLIERIKLYMEKNPRFIGMSATLNREDYKQVKNFFISDRTTDVLLDNSKNDLESTKSYYESNIKKNSIKALEEIYNYSQKESMLVFPNSRGDVERLAVGLSRLGKKRGSDTRYFAHHSSVSKDMRLIAEKFAKTSKRQLFTICCTSTLELGIDIGSVDSIVQYNAPHSVASLGQRLGRSGRITRKNILHLIGTDEWSLLQGLAALSLYEEGVLDRFNPITKPYDVLAHQVISILLEYTGMSLENLNNINQKYKCWNQIEDEEYLELIEHLIDKKYIEILENEAITGLETEKLLRGSDFFVHFETQNNFSVYSNDKKIGEIPLSPSVQTGVNIFLSGQIWKIKDIELRSKKIYVSKALDGNPPMFLGNSGNVTNEIRSRMKAILEDKTYWVNYNDNIKEVLIKLAEENLKHEYFQWIEKNDEIGLRTFQGTKINRTILLLLNMFDKDGKYKLDDRETYISGTNIKRYINNIIEKEFEEEKIYDYLKNNLEIIELYLSSNKYKELLPLNLKINYIIKNILDLNGAKKYLGIII